MPTLLGFGAILLWAALALLTSLTTRIPLFEWLALTFGLATLLSVPMLLRTGALASLRAADAAEFRAALAASPELAAEVLGENVFNFVLANKRREWAEYRSQVTAFEIEQNLRSL